MNQAFNGNGRPRMARIATIRKAIEAQERLYSDVKRRLGGRSAEAYEVRARIKQLEDLIEARERRLRG